MFLIATVIDEDAAEVDNDFQYPAGMNGLKYTSVRLRLTSHEYFVLLYVFKVKK